MYLEPMWLDENMLVRTRLTDNPDKIAVSTKGVSALILRAHCMVYNYERNHWHYYSLPKRGHGWFLGRSSERLWGIVTGRKLATFDLRSGEWIEFQHRTDYDSILYADESTVIALCSEILAIDVLRLERGRLQRVVNVPISIISPDSYTRSCSLPQFTSAFWLEKDQFIVLEMRHPHERQNSSQHSQCTLWSLALDGQLKAILDVAAHKALLHLPFFIAHDEQEGTITFVNLCEDPLEPISVAMHYESEHEECKWNLLNAFTLDNDLIVMMKSQHKEEERAAIIRLGEQDELLFYRSSFENTKLFRFLWRYKIHQLGRFLLLGNEWAYDLVARQEIQDVSASAAMSSHPR